jgi:CheY-like chemotaxis protein
MMSQLLKLGFDSVTAANGREAHNFLQNADKPNLILLD